MAMSSAVGDHSYFARYWVGENVCVCVYMCICVYITVTLQGTVLERECVCVCVYLFVCVCVESEYESSVCVPQDQHLLDQVPKINSYLYVK